VNRGRILNSQEIQKLGFKLVGQVGVNVGTIMIIDPSDVLDEKQYQEFMDVSNGGSCQFKDGMIIPSGWGDGNYHVYVQENKEGRTLRVLVDFTSTYGYDGDNPEMHDIDMEDVFDFVSERQLKEGY